MAKKVISCSADTKLRIPLAELNEIQGELKFMSEENAARLRKSFIDDGIDFAFHVWRDQKKKWWLIDGHGRTKLLKLMVGEGYVVEDIPCVETKAKSYEQARLKVLRSSSIYHQTSKQGLYEFLEMTGLNPESLNDYNLPDISIPEFKMEFYSDEAKSGTREEDSSDNAEALEKYKNNTIKQIVLYYPASDYEKMLKRLDTLLEKYKAEDYSELIWKLAHENRTIKK